MIYLLYRHDKGIDFASGYGEEVLMGYARTEEEAIKWVSEFKETGFQRRLYKKLRRRIK